MRASSAVTPTTDPAAAARGPFPKEPPALSREQSSSLIAPQGSDGSGGMLHNEYEQVVLERAKLRFTMDGKRMGELERAFQEDNARRYLRFVRVTSWVFLVANILFVGYDIIRFGDKPDVLPWVLGSRLGLIVPFTALLVAMTYHSSYGRHPQLLAIPSLVVGGGIVVYSVVGKDPGYGTLAVLIVYMYSFTPIDFFRASFVTLALIVCFAVLLIELDAEGELVLQGVSLGDLIGVLSLFWVAVGFIGHTLEYSLRRSFLDEQVLARQRDMLQKEERLVNSLLENMLPPSVSKELKRGRHLIADEYSVVTVLFCEIYHFADITARIAPDTVVTILNTVYSAFDALIEQFGVYKVETVGEVYMVVGGCPEPKASHAIDAARMAKAMLDAMPSIRQRIDEQVGNLGLRLQIRVGLNSGPIVAGIVGIKNPRYKLFGDTVNTASRMESTCLPGRVQVSNTTEVHLRGRFELEARGGIKVKGKGTMQTYFLGDEIKGAAAPTVIDDLGETPTMIRSSHGGVPRPRKSTARERGDGGGDGGDGGDGDGDGGTDGSTSASESKRGGKQLWGAMQAAMAARTLFSPASMAQDELSRVFAVESRRGTRRLSALSETGDDAPGDAKEHDSRGAAPVGAVKPHATQSTLSTRASSKPVNSSTTVIEVAPRASAASDKSGRSGSPADELEAELEQILSSNRSDADKGRMLSGLQMGHTQSFKDALERNAGQGKWSEYDRIMDTWQAVAESQAGDSLRIQPKQGAPAAKAGDGDGDGGAQVPYREAEAVKTGAKTPQDGRRRGVRGFLSRFASAPGDGGGHSGGGGGGGKGARGGGARRRKRKRSCVPRFVTSFVPEEGLRVVLWYSTGDDRLGLLEPMFQVEAAPGWRRFMQLTAILGAVSMGLFAFQDVIKYDTGDPRDAEIWFNVGLTRYAVATPVLLIWLALSLTKAFSRNRALALVSSSLTVWLIGLSIIAVSVLGREPGYGILALFIVYGLNLSLLPFFYRLAILGSLIPTYLVAVNLWNRDVVTNSVTLEHLSYLLVFYFGQGVPVLAREYYLRDNFHRKCKMQLQSRKLAAEQARSNALLESMLPKQIAQQLKAGKERIAGHFEQASILFTDMKGFTAFSATITPTELVGFLNNMYSKFDRIADKYGIYKVEIIGDAYFGVAGCPDQVPDHAERCANAAFEMLDVLPELREIAGAEINMRVGIHTGPVVAGVVGNMDPRYHLFGESVSLAMAMESNGIPGLVHISPQAYDRMSQRMRLRVDEYRRTGGKPDASRFDGDMRVGAGFFEYEPREPMEIYGETRQTYLLRRAPPPKLMGRTSADADGDGDGDGSGEAASIPDDVSEMRATPVAAAGTPRSEV